MEIFTFAAVLAYPQLFKPGKIEQSARDHYGAAACIRPQDESTMPEWVEVKDLNWRSSFGSKHRCVYLNSNFSFPVFGLSAAWHSDAAARNLSVDRLLIGANAEVSITRVVKQDMRSGRGRTFANPVAIRVVSEPAIPTYEDFIESERAR